MLDFAALVTCYTLFCSFDHMLQFTCVQYCSFGHIFLSHALDVYCVAWCQTIRLPECEDKKTAPAFHTPPPPAATDK